MGKVNYAAIDIGSNAVRLLIKSIDREAVQEKKIKKVMMLRVPLRLGFDVFSIGELSEKKADKLRRLMKAFRQLMKIYDVDDYRACATSAMRDARNGRTIIKKIEKDTGIRIEIIDGQEEARMIYNNHIEQVKTQLTREPYPQEAELFINEAPNIFSHVYEDFKLENYKFYPAIKGEVAV